MKMMAVPEAARERRTSKSPVASCGVRTAVGSSRMRIFEPR
jgi:hypothetical protein